MESSQSATAFYNLNVNLYFTFKTRNLPSNCNESKFIAVSVYSTVLVCLAAVPVYTTAIELAQKILTLIVAFFQYLS